MVKLNLSHPFDSIEEHLIMADFSILDKNNFQTPLFQSLIPVKEKRQVIYNINKLKYLIRRIAVVVKSKNLGAHRNQLP